MNLAMHEKAENRANVWKSNLDLADAIAKIEDPGIFGAKQW